LQLCATSELLQVGKFTDKKILPCFFAVAEMMEVHLGTILWKLQNSQSGCKVVGATHSEENLPPRLARFCPNSTCHVYIDGLLSSSPSSELWLMPALVNA